MCNLWLFLVLNTLVFVSNARKLSSSAILGFHNSTDKIALLISIDTDKSEGDTVTIVIIAPIYHNYVAIGFGSHEMKSTYSIVLYSNNNIEEYYLSSKGKTSTQKRLDSSISIEDIEDEYQRGTITVIITRDINGISDYHYSFNHIDDFNELDIIYAMSQNIYFHHNMKNNLDYHGIYKNFTTLMFSEVFDINKTENDFIDDLFDINNTESILYTTTDDIDDNVYHENNDKIFMFFNAMQWIVIGAMFCCFVIMSFILMCFLRCYRRRTKKWEITDQQKLGHITPEIHSMVQHCYNPNSSILTQIDSDNNYNYIDQNNRSVGSIDDFLMRMITQDNNNNANHDLIRIEDDNDENISDLSESDSVRM